MKPLLAIALLLAGPALAQSPAQPQPAAPQPQASGERRLNLRLDDSDLRALSRDSAVPRDPAPQRSADGLPGLGEGARPMERAPVGGSRNPFPPDSERR